MKKSARVAVLLSILLYPLDGFKFRFAQSLSLFRVALIVAGFLFICSSIRLRFPRRLVTPYIFTTMIGAPMAYLLSTVKDYAMSSLFNELSGILLILMIVTLFDYDDICILLKQFIRASYISIPFAMFSWLVLFQNPNVLNTMANLGGVFSLEVTEELIVSCYNMRMVLPYSSSSVCSGIMAVNLAILVCDKELYGDKTRTFLICCFSMILLLTQARTGMLAFAVFMLFHIVKNKNKKSTSAKVLFVIVLIFVLFISLNGNEDFTRKLNSRFSNIQSAFTKDELLSNRHFLLPIEGIIIWFSGIKNFLLGIGYGSGINIMGRYTSIPYFFFNSYVTQIVTKGLHGLVLVVIWLRTKHELTKLNRLDSNNNAIAEINSAYMVLLLSSLTYEFYMFYVFFIIFGIALLAVTKKKQADILNLTMNNNL